MDTSERKPLRLTVRNLIDNYISRIDLDADYQREFVWNREKQEELLDSIISDIDIPKLYLAELKNNEQFDYECIDGKQRLLTIQNFLLPDRDDKRPLLINFLKKKYSYKQLKREHPSVAIKIDKYELDFVIYNKENIDEKFIREIFRRLQLGIQLNSGEMLKSMTGSIRDFIFKKIGKNGPFFVNSGLSNKRYSREFTLAQICINSFKRKDDSFVRARLYDLVSFFEENSQLVESNSSFSRINEVLEVMNKAFDKEAIKITSRATAVSAYLFLEKLFLDDKKDQYSKFANFYISLLDEIKKNLGLLSKYEEPKNRIILEEFQKYISQASVEERSIERRNEFLKKAFNYYLIKRKIIDDSQRVKYFSK